MVPTMSLSVDSREDPATRCGFRRSGRGAGGWGSNIAHVAWGRWVKACASSRTGRAVHPLENTYLLELGRVYAAAWNEGEKAVESGQPVAAALKGVGQSWDSVPLSVAAWKGGIFAGQSEPAIGLRKENGPEECRRPRDGRSRVRRRAGVARVVASGGCAPLRELSTVTARERGKAGSPWGGGMVDGACSPAPDPERPPVERRPRESAPGLGRSECPAKTLLLQPESMGFRLGTRANPSQRGRGNREDNHGGNWSDWVSKAMYRRSLSRRTGVLFICTYGSRWPSGATSVDSRTTSRHSEISGERPHTAVSDVCGPTERHASLRLCASEEITTLFGPSDGRLGENRFP